MLKFLLIFLFSVLSVYCENLNATRIAGGAPAAKGENLDFVSLKVIFQQQFQTCGGTLIAKNLVLTTATCVQDPVEGDATIITATFPLNKKFVGQKVAIVVNPGYDYTTHGGNLAVIVLEKPVVPDDKTIKIAEIVGDNTVDYTGAKMRVCGIGTTSDKYTPPKSLMCADMTMIDPTTCGTNSDILCSENVKIDNVCNGDYGTPLYKYSYAGKVITQSVVGLASWTPNGDPQAPCLDGHHVEYTRLSAYKETIDGLIADLGVA